MNKNNTYTRYLLNCGDYAFASRRHAVDNLVTKFGITRAKAWTAVEFAVEDGIAFKSEHKNQAGGWCTSDDPTCGYHEVGW